jgi:hypothetical protein
MFTYNELMDIDPEDHNELIKEEQRNIKVFREILKSMKEIQHKLILASQQGLISCEAS